MQRRHPRLISGEECWLCPTCGEWKPRRDYFSSARSWNGIGGQCRKCHGAGNVRTRDPEKSRKTTRESMARQRARDIEKFRERDRLAARKRPWTSQREARYRLNLAIRRGEVVRPTRCSRCGEQRKIHAHHPDYSRPLYVEWLCTLCHGEEHRTAFKVMTREPRGCVPEGE